MGHGGRRNRSGSLPDERSARSDGRNYRLDALPNEPYDGPIPDFPIPDPTPRELEVWERTWRLPQAWAWSQPSETWRTPTVAMYVRQAVKCEALGVAVGHLAQLHRFADQVGLSTAGLAEMGWKVASDGDLREPPKPPRPRLRSIKDDRIPTDNDPRERLAPREGA